MKIFALYEDIMNLKNISKMVAQILKQKTNGSYQYVPKHLIFEVKPPLSPNISPLDFYLWGHLKTLLYFN